MRFFDTDWNMILTWLGVWEKLSRGARRHYLAGKSHAQSLDPEGYGTDLPLALSLGLVEQVSTGRVRPTKASAGFRSLMVQLVKWPLFDGKPDRAQLEEYLHKHYPADEAQTLSPWKEPGWDSATRAESFLAAKDVSRRELPLLSYYETHEAGGGYEWTLTPKPATMKTWFPSAEATVAAQLLVRRALESKRPWGLAELVGLLPGPLRPAMDPALRACFRHALLFAALDKQNLDLLVGVCPFVLHLASRPAPVPPPVEPCANAEALAFHLEDMTQLLAVAAADECLLNQGSYYRQFFKSVETRLKEEFVPLPSWMGRGPDFLERLHNAADSLLGLRFVTDTHRKEAKRKLKATIAGKKWLERPPAERVKEILFEFQRFWKQEDWEDEKDPSDGYDVYFDDEDDPSEAEEDGDNDPRKLNLLKWQKSVWRQAPVGECVELESFLDYHARASRPDDGETRGYGRRVGRNDENVLWQEELSRERLANFFWRVLVPYGCVRVARRGDRLWFGLTDYGRYLVGITRTLHSGTDATSGTVVVQPNFEIVFLGPDLGAEVSIAHFAERCGRNVGTLFRLTRPKMIQAAARGLTCEAVLKTLRTHSSTPLPENVVAEVKSWFAACRSVVTRQSTLIETGDPETALMIRQILGEKCAALSATLLEWPEPAIPTDLARKLRERGVFLQSA